MTIFVDNWEFQDLICFIFSFSFACFLYYFFLLVSFLFFVLFYKAMAIRSLKFKIAFELKAKVVVRGGGGGRRRRRRRRRRYINNIRIGKIKHATYAAVQTSLIIFSFFCAFLAIYTYISKDSASKNKNKYN